MQRIGFVSFFMTSTGELLYHMGLKNPSSSLIACALSIEPSFVVAMNVSIDETQGPTARPTKLRKIRKGTKSCWECKRRKIRCIFSSSDDVACICCQQRRVQCISQDIPEDLAAVGRISNSRHLGERMAAVEAFISEFVTKKPFPDQAKSAGVGREQEIEAFEHEPEYSPRSSQRQLPQYSTFEKVNVTKQKHNSRSLGMESGSANTPISHLLAAFPIASDVRILLEKSRRTSLYTHFTNAQPHSRLTSQSMNIDATSPNDSSAFLEAPGPDVHPVILARQMLIFAITLQSPCGENIHSLSQPQDVLMCRLVAAVTTSVTTKEDMYRTVEGVLCIILEAVYEVNCGNLRKAWVAYRRAMTAAQLIGLQRSPLPRLKRIDPGLDIDPAFIWFRIVYMDRYLSLLLGLPQGTTDKSMGIEQNLWNEPPLGKFERHLTVVASRILERNESAFGTTSTDSFAVTQSIDSDLLKVAREMPSSFWQLPNFHNLRVGSPETLLEIVRLGAQVYYYSILIQLYLPFMMHGNASHANHAYAKINCVNASREIMTRFISHRTFNPESSCSRPVDFFALLAAMTLLLAHLDTHQQATNFNAHQRFSDRAMLEQVLERMDIINKRGADAMAMKSAELIRYLLDIEADAAAGSLYTHALEENDEDFQGIERSENELRLHIPYLGTVKITRQCTVSTVATGSPQITTESQRGQPLLFHESPITTSQVPLPEYKQPDELPSITADFDDWIFQGVDMAFFDSLMKRDA